ncbi:fatty acid desaturase [Ectobacillus sp. sgz5001026]|jgi:omega-6 fatty acid desaturase (delta-12 desaturase)|uniref:fatty acid desaturase n=1 Tax=Ectobacillus sp. sgz5001026 TaxID=3242473 RepID=UPI0036D3397F
MTLNNSMNIRKQVAPFEKSTTKASVVQILNTIVPFFLLWYLAYQCLSLSYFLTLIVATLAAGFLVRIFIIFHDCCHHSFFKNRLANKILGTITGVLTAFPYEQWAHDHSVHHATSSNLDKRGTGDIWVLTVDEYREASFWRKISYRIYRNPIIMFGLGPIFIFLLKNRFNRRDAGLKERMNLYLTNILIVAVVGLVCLAIGWKAFLLVQGPIFLISGSAGIWLFYVQHTFEDSYFEEDENWEYIKAAVEGSSFYKLPKLLQWITGNIGYHHVHHLSPRVPNYKLEAAHNNSELLKHVPTITLATSIRSIRFHLWDEEEKKFVGYNHIKSESKKTISTRVKPGL